MPHSQFYRGFIWLIRHESNAVIELFAFMGYNLATDLTAQIYNRVRIEMAIIRLISAKEIDAHQLYAILSETIKNSGGGKLVFRETRNSLWYGDASYVEASGGAQPSVLNGVKLNKTDLAVLPPGRLETLIQICGSINPEARSAQTFLNKIISAAQARQKELGIKITKPSKDKIISKHDVPDAALATVAAFTIGAAVYSPIAIAFAAAGAALVGIGCLAVKVGRRAKSAKPEQPHP